MRAYAPPIAQGEGRSLGEWENRGVSLGPRHPSRASKQHSFNINLL